MKTRSFVLHILFIFLSASVLVSCDADEKDYLDDEFEVTNTKLIERDKVESPATNK